MKADHRINFSNADLRMLLRILDAEKARRLADFHASPSDDAMIAANAVATLHGRLRAHKERREAGQ